MSFPAPKAHCPTARRPRERQPVRARPETGRGLERASARSSRSLRRRKRMSRRWREPRSRCRLRLAHCRAGGVGGEGDRNEASECAWAEQRRARRCSRSESACSLSRMAVAVPAAPAVALIDRISEGRQRRAWSTDGGGERGAALRLQLRPFRKHAARNVAHRAETQRGGIRDIALGGDRSARSCRWRSRQTRRGRRSRDRCRPLHCKAVAEDAAVN